jgi:hypothetical protein
MASAGYASPARYAMPAAACACVLAGVGVAALRARRRFLATVALAFCLGFAAQQLTRLDDQVHEGIAVARSNEQLRAAVSAAGGADALRRCAQRGWLAVNHTSQSALAWELRSGLGHLALTMRRPGLLVRAPRSATTGAPPRIVLAPPLQRSVRAREGSWSVVAVSAPGAPLPTACSGRKASGAPRRIPNI